MANEKRLTTEEERASLIRCLKMRHDAQFTPGVYEHSIIGRAALFLEKTVDAVEVVRCMACIYAELAEDGDLYCDGPIGICGTVGFNDFCSYGKRRTE